MTPLLFDDRKRLIRDRSLIAPGPIRWQQVGNFESENRLEKQVFHAVANPTSEHHDLLSSTSPNDCARLRQS